MDNNDYYYYYCCESLANRLILILSQCLLEFEKKTKNQKKKRKEKEKPMKISIVYTCNIVELSIFQKGNYYNQK